MRGNTQESWWQETSRLAAIVAGGAVIACLVPVLLSRLFTGTLFFGLPFPLFLLALVLPFGGVAAIFWFARKQDDFDHRYDVAGE